MRVSGCGKHSTWQKGVANPAVLRATAAIIGFATQSITATWLAGAGATVLRATAAITGFATQSIAVTRLSGTRTTVLRAAAAIIGFATQSIAATWLAIADLALVGATVVIRFASFVTPTTGWCLLVARFLARSNFIDFVCARSAFVVGLLGTNCGRRAGREEE